MTFLKRTSGICSNCGMSVPEGMQNCQECGALYTDPAPAMGAEYNFCVICSAKLVDTPPVMPATPAAPAYSPSTSFGWTCPKCRVTTPDMDANFCTTCSAPRDRMAEAALSEEVTLEVRNDYSPVSMYSDDEVTVSVTSADSLPRDVVTPSTPMSSFTPVAPVMPVAPAMPVTPVAPVSPVRPGDVVIPPTRDRSIPDIPDIMKPLTNSDMKR